MLRCIDNPSAKINLPSASVFNTSIVLPLYAVNTSPGFTALDPLRFSVEV